MLSAHLWAEKHSLARQNEIANTKVKPGLTLETCFSPNVQASVLKFSSLGGLFGPP